MKTPFYDPNLSYEKNYLEGPFGRLCEPATLTRQGQPKFTFLGFKLHSLFGIPAGPLLNANFVQAAFQHGFDVCVYKTVRTRAYLSNPFPNVLAIHLRRIGVGRKNGVQADQKYQQPLSITNSFGVPSAPPSTWQADMTRAVQSAQTGQLMIGSFQGTWDKTNSVEKFSQDFAEAAKLTLETGAKVLEANLSCPNEGTTNLLCFDLERTKLIVKKIRQAIGPKTPLLLKIAYFADDQYLEKFVTTLAPLVSGFAAINTIPAKIINEHGKQALPGKGRLVSGVCGQAIQWAGLSMVERLAKVRQKHQLNFVIVGVGGVMTPADFRKYRRAGADLVMSATGAIWNADLGREIYESEQPAPKKSNLNHNLSIKVQVARALLKTGAIGFKIDQPLTFKSGLISPVYIDNRTFPYHPREWKVVINGFQALSTELGLDFSVVAGIEAAGIPHSAALGFYLNKPSVFTRKAVKDHGTKKMVEGGSVRNERVLLIEDHVTTGHSSLLGVSALRQEGARVDNCFAITSYNFSEAKVAFAQAQVNLHTLTDFETILSEASRENIISAQEQVLVEDWLNDPWGWAKRSGHESKK